MWYLHSKTKSRFKIERCLPSQVAADVVSWRVGNGESERSQEPSMTPEQEYFKNQERKSGHKRLKEAAREEAVNQPTAVSQPNDKRRVATAVSKED